MKREQSSNQFLIIPLFALMAATLLTFACAKPVGGGGVLAPLLLPQADGTLPGGDGTTPIPAPTGTPGVLLIETAGSTVLSEGGAADEYTLLLNSEPSAPVTLTVTADAQSTVNGGATVDLTFDNNCPGATCWSTGRVVSVLALDDFVAEGAHASTVTHALNSSDGDYDGMTVADVSASITDNDTAGGILTESGGSTSVTEGGASDTYQIRLSSQPTGTVTVDIAFDPTQVTLNGSSSSPLSLNFDAGSWNNNQNIVIAAVADGLTEGAHTATLTHTASGGGYGGVGIASLIVSISDPPATPAGKRIFITASTYRGTASDGINGIANVDALCQSDANHPGDGSTYKAMIVDGTNRRACSTANCSGGVSENIDWVFAPNTTYVRATSTSTEIFTTDASGIFPFGSLTNNFTGSATTFWTGLSSGWQTDSNTCSGWQGSGGSSDGRVGIGNALGAGAIFNAIVRCNQERALLCVEE